MWGSKKVEIAVSKMWAVWWAGKNSPSEFSYFIPSYVSCLFGLVRGCELSFWRGISATVL